MRLLTLTLVSALALAGCKKVDGPDAAALPEVSVPDLSEATMKDVTRTLSSDAFEGRAPGTAGEEKTVALMIEKFKAAGLEPGNPSSAKDGGWTQDVPLVEIAAKNFSPLTITGKDGKAMSFAYGSEYVAGSYQEQAKIDIKDSDVVFVGYGINAPEKGWNDYAGVDVKGKTVLILVNDPDFETSGLEGPFGGKAMTYYGRWTYKFEEAARQGAAAALIVHDTAPAAYGWNVVNSSWTVPQFLAQSKNGGGDQTKANDWGQKDVSANIMPSGAEERRALGGHTRSSSRRSPSWLIQTIWRAGVPTTSAWAGTARLTTAPAPMKA